MMPPRRAVLRSIEAMMPVDRVETKTPFCQLSSISSPRRAAFDLRRVNVHRSGSIGSPS